MSPDRLREAIASRVSSPPDGSPSDVARVAEGVRRAGGEAVLGIVFFGSRKTKARPDPYSAYDLVVAVSAYRPFYESLRASGHLARRPSLVALLNAVLPPNQVSVVVPGPDGERLRAKCAVVSLSTLVRETSRERRDHFLMGRLFQSTAIVYAADQTRERLLDALMSAHRLTFGWVRPWLPERFDAAAYARTLLQVSFRAEIRPEPAGRAEALFAAQQGYLVPVYDVLLSELAASGEIVPAEPGVYSRVLSVSVGETLRLRAYFAWSLVRATTRWAKYVITFEGWLDFIVRKARRHSGQDIVLTERERRLPLVFLWPRVLRYLRHKDRD